MPGHLLRTAAMHGNLMIGGSDGNSAMNIERTGHVFLSERFVGKFDFLEQVDN